MRGDQPAAVFVSRSRREPGDEAAEAAVEAVGHVEPRARRRRRRRRVPGCARRLREAPQEHRKLLRFKPVQPHARARLVRDRGEERRGSAYASVRARDVRELPRLELVQHPAALRLEQTSELHGRLLAEPRERPEHHRELVRLKPGGNGLALASSAAASAAETRGGRVRVRGGARAGEFTKFRSRRLQRAAQRHRVLPLQHRERPQDVRHALRLELARLSQQHALQRLPKLRPRVSPRASQRPRQRRRRPSSELRKQRERSRLEREVPPRVVQRASLGVLDVPPEAAVRGRDVDDVERRREIVRLDDDSQVVDRSRARQRVVDGSRGVGRAPAPALAVVASSVPRRDALALIGRGVAAAAASASAAAASAAAAARRRLSASRRRLVGRRTRRRRRRRVVALRGDRGPRRVRARARESSRPDATDAASRRFGRAVAGVAGVARGRRGRDDASDARAKRRRELLLMSLPSSRGVRRRRRRAEERPRAHRRRPPRSPPRCVARCPRRARRCGGPRAR